ncbi:S8 family serine peptidase [Salinarimonas ramus]|uniref:S8 family serine peptidase n=1 Tax=Salinarimonas ramus TaxID=690164 RepID=UPI001662E83A|nr:S8 family serine peptidase [Salinarimonas ramus]
MWEDHLGAGVRVGIFDDGSRVANSALSSAFSTGSGGVDGRHATAVAGIVAADGRGGAVGIAPLVEGRFVQVLGTSMLQISQAMNDQDGFDVVNHSWGWTRDLYVDRTDPLFSTFFAGIDEAAREGRGGLGTIMVAAAGNDGARGGDANLSHFPSDRKVIAVAAVTDAGTVADFSNTGASILVSGLSGGGARGITTTDIAGSEGYSTGDVTDRFSGTSAAAPTVTGVVALMLDANPALGWRDVQEILALTARGVSGTRFVENEGTGWNGGGLAFSTDAGFGLVDARAAVRLAETWSARSTSANEASLAGEIDVAATPLVTGATVVLDVALSGAALLAETVELTLEGVHGRIGDLLVELVSPTGTVASVLDSTRLTAAFDGWTFAVNAFRGEIANGTWSVRVTDRLGGTDGVLTGARIEAYGRAEDENDVYVYTDRFSELRGGDRGTLVDGAGHDVLNAAAVSSDLVIDLAPGATSRIAGRDVTMGSQTLIEDVFGGDGDDTISGNDLDNLIVGGRGDDTLFGHGGNDVIRPGQGDATIDGGAGFDTVRIDGVRADWEVVRAPDGALVATGREGARIEMVSIEHVTFGDAELVMPTTSAQLQVADLYVSILGRPADGAGLAGWSTGVERGTLGLADVAQALMESAEFGARALDASGIVSGLYREALGREAASAEVASWLDAVREGGLSLAQVAAHVVSAPETSGLNAPVEYWL